MPLLTVMHVLSPNPKTSSHKHVISANKCLIPKTNSYNGIHTTENIAIVP